jgi:hypothetical protein
MKININTTALKDKILKPVNLLVEDCVLTLSENKIQSIASLEAGGIIIYAEHQISSDLEAPVSLNIKNINKLVSVLNCITDDTADMIIETNHIKYASKGFKFKFHLTEDGVIVKPKISAEKILGMVYNTSSTINIPEFQSILKSSSYLNSDQVRLYFYTKVGEERGIYCDITNRNIVNSDSISIKVSDDFDGDPITGELICDVEHIRKLTVCKNSNLRIYFNSKIGYTVFDVIEPNGLIRYILPTLSK